MRVAVDADDRGGPLNEALVGVNHVTEASAPALRAIGDRWARTDVSFEADVNGTPVYNCSTGSWDPTFLDSHVAADRAAGAVPQLIVDYSPPCLTTPPVSGNVNHAPPDVGPDAARWEALVYEMALHEIQAEGVRIFEVWNEPNGFFWTGGLDGYLKLYSDTAGALERAADATHTHILVGGPALADFFDKPDLGWIDALLNLAEQTKVPVDFLSWHLYANDFYLGPSSSGFGPFCFGQPPGPDGACWYNPNLRAQVYGSGARLVSGEVAKYPGLHPLLWLDEWNVDAGYDARHDGTYGGAFVAASLDSAQGSTLDRMSFFEAVDEPNDKYGNWGLLHTDLSPKPSYEVFALWHRMSGGQLKVALSPDQSGADPDGRIGAVATSRDGRTSVLVYNFAPEGPSGLAGPSSVAGYTHHVELEVTGLDRGEHEITGRLVDTSHSGAPLALARVKGPTARVSFSLEGQGVILVTVANGHGDDDDRS